MKDSVRLLRECEAEGKQALVWLEKAEDETDNLRIKRLLSRYETLHNRFCTRVEEEIVSQRRKKKGLPLFKKAEIWMKLHAGLLMRHTDSEIASLLSDACFDRTKRLCHALNSCHKAEQNSVALLRELIRIQERCAEDLREFL